MKKKVDSEPIKKPDELLSITENINSTPIKMSFLIFIIFIIITSDVFVEKIMGNNKNYIEGRNVTTQGACIQGLLMSIVYLLLYTLVVNDYL